MLKHKFVAAWSEFLLYYLIQAFSNLNMTQLKKKKSTRTKRNFLCALLGNVFVVSGRFIFDQWKEEVRACPRALHRGIFHK